MSVTPPNLNNPLINEPAQPNPGANTTGLGPLAHLVGTWTNQNLGSTGAGGTTSPYSYNLMPLPTSTAAAGYILKNFKYYEEITFSPIHGAAPNRGGNYTQTCNVLFYEQRVYFAEGPAKDKLVHAENGSFLYLTTGPQAEGPYNPTPTVPNDHIPPQSSTRNLAKQIAVPHGNSILAQGSIPSYGQTGSLSIPGNIGFPYGTDKTDPYHTQSVGNPHPGWNANTNQPLQNSLTARPCHNWLPFSVNSNSGGKVSNIPFEQEKANVINYEADYWLQAFDGSTEFTQLAYSQIILMSIPIGGRRIVFPHTTCNVLTKVR